ncbi:MAG: DNA-binding protein, partial [Deltaproteobacteria bacterium]|nr:DNA-binding protein [Deltaproteobacteria bacterium]
MRLVNEKFISEKFGRAVQTLRNDRFAGKGFPYIRVGRSIRYDLDEVEGIIQKKRIETKGF